jgi:hypothetical protein
MGAVVRILITGSRDLMDRELVWSSIEEVIEEYGAIGAHLILGGARGADELAREWSIANADRCTSETFVANWRELGRAAGPMRNAQMVKAGADLCLAFPRGESRGTRNCMMQAGEAGIPVREK